jgi:hypothetical protein
MATSHNDGIPLKGNPRSGMNAALVTTIGMGLLSLAGLLITDQVYPTDDLKQAFLSNDYVNLFVGLPALLLPLWLARRGSLGALLCLPGGLIYVVYNYIAYAFGRPLDIYAAGDAALVLFSAYAAFRLWGAIDHEAIRARLADAAPVRLAGWVLVIFGLFFIARAIGMLAGEALPAVDVGVLIADLVVSMAWVGGGILLLRRHALGYSAGPGLLFAACVLIAGLIAYFVVQPFLDGTPFALTDVLVVAGFGLVCFIPILRILQAVRSGQAEKVPKQFFTS